MRMKLDVVVPFYNEQDCAREFVQSLAQALDSLSGLECRYYLVDDGSSDATPSILKELAAADDRIQVIHLWGNHGHQRSLTAGLDQCEGDAVMMLDGDGQHPVDVAKDLVRQFVDHPDIAVVQAVRRGEQHGRLKNWASRFFYWMINKLVPEAGIVPGSSDFRVMSAEVLHLVRAYSDRYRNLRVLLASLGLPTIHQEYLLHPRIAGKSKYNWPRMIRLATDGMFAFSALPLRFSLFLMAFTGLLGMSYAGYSLVVYFQGQVVPGWTSLVALIALLFSAVFGVLAIMSEYIARIYEDVRRYPVYRIRPKARKARGAGREECFTTEGTENTEGESF